VIGVKEIVGFFKNFGSANNSNNSNNSDNSTNSNNSSSDDPKRNQMRLNFRIIGCIALGYIAFGMFSEPPPEDAINPIIRIGAASIFMGFAVIMGVITTREYIIVWRANKEAQQKAAEIAESADSTETELSKNDDYEDDYYEDEDDDFEENYEDDEHEDREDNEKS